MVEEKVIELLKEKVDEENITSETKFADLGIDSLDIAELMGKMREATKRQFGKEKDTGVLHDNI